jgi:hypothetical protein
MKNKIFDKFISRLGLYNGLIAQNKSQLENIISTYKKTSRQISPDLSLPMSTTKFVYRNVLTKKHEIAYSHLVDNKTIKETTGELNLLFCNLCISQSYEAFETFLKSIIALKLIENPNIATKLNPDFNLQNYESCRKSLNAPIWEGRKKNNKHLFKTLYELVPDIKLSERENSIDFDFKEWYIVFSEVRNSIVHSNSIIDLAVTKKYTKFQKEIFTKLFFNSTSSLHNISTIENYSYLLKIVAQHGQLIKDKL